MGVSVLVGALWVAAARLAATIIPANAMNPPAPMDDAAVAVAALALTEALDSVAAVGASTIACANTSGSPKAEACCAL